MNTFTRHAWILCLAASATSAFANTAEAPSPQKIEITAPSGAKTAAQALLSMGNMDRTYEMSNGRTMKVSTFGDTVRLRYGRRATTLLRYDGHGQFVSSDGNLVLRFELDDVGDPEKVSLSMPAAWA